MARGKTKSKTKKVKKATKRTTSKKSSKKVTKKKVVKKKAKKKVTKALAKKKKTKKTVKKKVKKKIAKKKVLKKKSKRKIAKKTLKKKSYKKTLKRSKSKATKKVKKKVKKKVSKAVKKKAKKVSKIRVTKKSKKILSEKEILNIKDEVDKAFEEEMVELKDAFGNKLCCLKDCDGVATVEDKNGQHYCRTHYISLWENIQIRNRILTGDVLKKFIEQIVKRYPDKFLEIMRKDLSTEKDFINALQDLEISEPASLDNHFGYDSDEVSEDY